MQGEGRRREGIFLKKGTGTTKESEIREGDWLMVSNAVKGKRKEVVSSLA